MTTTDRRGLIVGEATPSVGSSDPSAGIAIKTAVRVVTTANITLNSLQTIDGVTVAASDRVLVKDQSIGAENGIYLASSGNWTRTTDFDSVREVVAGTQVLATEGTTNATATFIVTTTGSITPGTTTLAISRVVISGARVIDATAATGSPSKFWNPTYFGNPGTAVVHRFNRALVGEAALGSSDLPMSTPDWLETLISNTTSYSQLVSVSAIGGLGVTGASRTSDYRTWVGSATGGAQGINGYALNDDTGSGNPIAAGITGLALHNNGITGISEGAEIGIGVQTTIAATITPFGGVIANTAFGINVSAGFTGYTANPSAAIIFGTSVTAKFQKGIVALASGLDTSFGAGGAGVAFEMGRNASVRWLNSGGTVDAEIWGNASGLNVPYPIIINQNAGALITPPVGTLFQSASADGVANQITLDAYGASSALNSRRSGGTGALKTATPSGVDIWQLNAFSHDGTSFTAAGKGSIRIATSELHSATAQGTQIDIYTTLNTTTTRSKVGIFQNSGGLSLGIGNTTDPGNGGIHGLGAIKSSGPTAGLGYATGAGGAVTQATNKATGAALSTVCGAVTMNNAALAAGTIVSFVLTNTAIAATDVLVLNHISGGTVGAYTLNAQAAAGSATINVRNNTAGSLGEAIVIQFVVIKGVNA